jgi:adenylate cyclase
MVDSAGMTFLSLVLPADIFQLETSLIKRVVATMGSSAGFSDRPSPRTTLLSRIPVAARIAACLAALVCGTLFLAVYLPLENQRQLLEKERRKLAEVVLAHYADTARVFILNDDILGLNLLLAQPPQMEGLKYVAVVDTRGIIMAHSDPARVGSLFEEGKKGENKPGVARRSMDRSSLPDAASLVDLTKRVVFGATELGSVHVGISPTPLRSGVKEDVLPLLYPPLLFGALTALTVVAVSRLWRTQSERGVSLPQRASLGRGGERAGSRNRASVSIDSAEGDGQEITRSQVAVLCAGIRGFREYAEAREAREVLRELNEYFSIAAESIVAHGGSIDKFLGDAVVAVFASSPLEADHSERAIRSAVALQKALLGEGKGDNQLLERVGIGISSGVVISGQIGPHLKKTYGSIGESFKAAYSLHLMAHPGGIVMSKEVYHGVEDLVSVEPLPPRRKVERFRSWENFRLLDLVGRKRNDSQP